MNGFENAAKTPLDQIVAALETFILTLPAEFQQPLRQHLSNLISRFSHDFNNRLTPITGFSELLLSQPDMLDDHERTICWLTSVNQSGQDAAALIKQLRSFYKIEEVQTKPAIPTVPVSGLKILVVDDEPRVREVVSEYLRVDGHKVVQASDGIEGLKQFDEASSEGRFDLVITDRAMPGITGDELARAIKQIAPGKPIIMLTGFGRLMQGIGELPEGVDLVIAKPVTITTLRQAIAKATAE